MLTIFVKAQSAHLRIQEKARRFAADASGATAIEYGLIAAGIAVAIIATVFALGDEIERFFQGVQTQLNSKQPG